MEVDGVTAVASNVVSFLAAIEANIVLLLNGTSTRPVKAMISVSMYDRVLAPV